MWRCLTSHLQVSDPTKLDHSSFHKNYWSRFVTHWKWVALEEKTRKSVNVCVCVCVCVREREIGCPLLKPISYSLRRQQIRQKTDIFRHSITERAVCVCVCVCVYVCVCVCVCDMLNVPVPSPLTSTQTKRKSTQMPTHGHTASVSTQQHVPSKESWHTKTHSYMHLRAHYITHTHKTDRNIITLHTVSSLQFFSPSTHWSIPVLPS